MGQPEFKPVQYSIWIGEEKVGETRVLRHPDIGTSPLKTSNQFDMVSIWDAVEKDISIYKRGNKKFLGTRKGEHYEWKSYQEAYDIAMNMAKGLEEMKLCPEFKSELNGTFRFLGIYSRNREEWVLSDLACSANSFTTVTFYDTLGDLAMEFILKQTQLLTLVIEAINLKKIALMAKENKTSNLKNLIVLENKDFKSEDIKKELAVLGFIIYSFDDIVEKGKSSNVTLTPSTMDTICTVCYTSGTTGLPKGVLLSNRTFMVEADILSASEFELLDKYTYLSFLPLAHNMERLIMGVIITHGIAVGFYSGDPRKILEDAQILKPDGICGVPRIFQRVYEAIQEKIKTFNPIKRKLIQRAIKDKITQFENTGIFTHIFWDYVVLKPFRDILGGKIKLFLTGSAPMAPDILTFLKVVFSTDVIEGYGQTENCSGMLLTRTRDPVAGHLGGPGWGNEVKLVDVPELGYLSTDVNSETGVLEPRGEICIRGPTLFAGYLNDEEKTKEAVDDEGWLHTGDIGLCLINHGNAIKIIDRKKNIFKLSQGEYIAPEKLENVLLRSMYVGKIMVHGDSFQNYLVALIVPRGETVIKFLKEKGIEVTKENYRDYFDREDLKKEIIADLTKIGKENDFKGFECVKKIFLCKEDFTIENDLLTPTLKVRRHNLKKKYKKEIDEIYGIIKKS